MSAPACSRGGTSIDARISRALPGISDELEDELNAAAGEPAGFLLVTFRFDTTAGRAQYIANVGRGVMIEQVVRLLTYWRHGVGDTPLMVTAADLPATLPGIAKRLESRLDQVAGEPIGFALLVFVARHDGRPSYLSNARRPDVTQQLQSLFEAWSAGVPDVPAHKVQ